MRSLSKWQRDQLPDCDFADGANRTMVLLDAEDVKHAVFRTNMMLEPKRTEVRRRIVEVALRKGLKMPPSLGVEAIGREISDYNARHGRQAEGDSTNTASGNTLRFTVRDEGDLTRACETAREKVGLICRPSFMYSNPFSDNPVIN